MNHNHHKIPRDKPASGGRKSAKEKDRKQQGQIGCLADNTNNNNVHSKEEILQKTSSKKDAIATKSVAGDSTTTKGKKRNYSKTGTPGFKKAPQAPKRFKSAYMFFSTEKHKEIRKELEKKGGQKVKTPVVAKLVSEAWKNQSPDERKMWDDIAEQDKRRYEHEKSNYSGPWKIQIDKTRPQDDPSYPKRPSSAFLAYSNERRMDVWRRNPGASNADVSRILSGMWKEAPEEVKQPYFNEERRLRGEYRKAKEKWHLEKRDEEEKKKLAATRQVTSYPIASTEEEESNDDEEGEKHAGEHETNRYLVMGSIDGNGETSDEKKLQAANNTVPQCEFKAESKGRRGVFKKDQLAGGSRRREESQRPTKKRKTLGVSSSPSPQQSRRQQFGAGDGIDDVRASVSAAFNQRNHGFASTEAIGGHEHEHGDEGSILTGRTEDPVPAPVVPSMSSRAGALTASNGLYALRHQEAENVTAANLRLLRQGPGGTLGTDEEDLSPYLGVWGGEYHLPRGARRNSLDTGVLIESSLHRQPRQGVVSFMPPQEFRVVDPFASFGSREHSRRGSTASTRRRALRNFPLIGCDHEEWLFASAMDPVIADADSTTAVADSGDAHETLLYDETGRRGEDGPGSILLSDADQFVPPSWASFHGVLPFVRAASSPAQMLFPENTRASAAAFHPSGFPPSEMTVGAGMPLLPRGAPPLLRSFTARGRLAARGGIATIPRVGQPLQQLPCASGGGWPLASLQSPVYAGAGFYSPQERVLATTGFETGPQIWWESPARAAYLNDPWHHFPSASGPAPGRYHIGARRTRQGERSGRDEHEGLPDESTTTRVRGQDEDEQDGAGFLSDDDDDTDRQHWREDFDESD